MKITGSREPLSKWFKVEVQGAIMDDVHEIVEDVTEGGARQMRQIISTSGTPKSGKEGRIETGKMLDEVKTDVGRGGNSVVGQFGWLDEQLDYFYYQDEGFRHWISGEMIPGMFALTQSYEEAKSELVRRIEEK